MVHFCHNLQVDIFHQLPLLSNHLRATGRTQDQGMYFGVRVTAEGLNMSLGGQKFGVPTGVGVVAEGLNMLVGSPGLGVLGNRDVGVGVGVNMGCDAQGPVHRSPDMSVGVGVGDNVF